MMIVMGRMRIVLLSLLPMHVLFAQFRNLVTTDDRSTLYFSTSFRLRGTSEYDSEKIFRFSSGAFQLVAQVQEQYTDVSGGDTNLYHLVEPDLSQDGSILVYTQTGDCDTPNDCMDHDVSEPAAIGATLPLPLPNQTARISPDGKYILTGQLLIRLADQASVTLPGTGVGDLYQTLGNSGEVLLSDSQGVFLFQDGNIRRLNLSAQPLLARMSRDASRIVYETSTPGVPNQLISYDTASGRETVLAVAAAPTPYNVPISFRGWTRADALCFTSNRPRRPSLGTSFWNPLTAPPSVR